MLTFGEARRSLDGIYTRPRTDTRALVVLLSGSGPTTQDGIPEGQRIKGIRTPFEVWAETLAVNGYASFRYDKRAAAYAEAYRTGVEVCHGLDDEYLRDLTDALAMLRSTGRGDGRPLFLLGHSLGAIAALAYATRDVSVRGVVTVSAPIEDLATTLKRQLADRLPDDSYHFLVEALDTALTGGQTPLILGLPAEYWRDYARYSLDRMLESWTSDRPVSLVHGTTDALIPHSQFLALRDRFKRHTNLSWVSVEGDHVLMSRKPHGPGDDGDYSLEPLVGWLTDRTSVSQSEPLP